MDPMLVQLYRQYLQQQPELIYPDDRLLVHDDIQDQLFRYFFDPTQNKYLPPPRYQARVLKLIVNKIERAVKDSDEEQVSDQLMECLSTLLTIPRKSATEEAQQMSILSYFPPVDLHNNNIHPNHIEPILVNEARNMIGAGENVGLRTWEAALRLGCYLTANKSIVQGETVLELGAGTGFLSVLCASYLGARRVVATDYLDEILENLQYNVRLNKRLLEKRRAGSASQDLSSTPPDIGSDTKEATLDHHTLDNNASETVAALELDSSRISTIATTQVAHLNWFNPSSLTFLNSSIDTFETARTTLSNSFPSNPTSSTTTKTNINSITVPSSIPTSSTSGIDTTTNLHTVPPLSTPNPSTTNQKTSIPFKPTLLLGADITYSPDLLPPLIETLSYFSNLNPSLRILISATQRNATTLQLLQQLCSAPEHKFKITEITDFEMPKLRDQTGFFHGMGMDVKILDIRKETS